LPDSEQKKELREYFKKVDENHIMFDGALSQAIHEQMPIEIKIIKKDGSGLIIYAIIKLGVLSIKNIQHSKEVQKLGKELISDREKLHYAGPELSMLGINAQNSIYKYLESLGIGEGLIDTLEKASFDKAMKNRMYQLNKMLEFFKSIY